MNTSNITNYKPKDFSELLGVSVKTLQRWDREGVLKANRTPTIMGQLSRQKFVLFLMNQYPIRRSLSAPLVTASPQATSFAAS